MCVWGGGLRGGLAGGVGLVCNVLVTSGLVILVGFSRTPFWILIEAAAGADDKAGRPRQPV